MASHDDEPIELTTLTFITTLHLDTATVEIPFVHLREGDRFRWDDGSIHEVTRTLFLVEKHSGVGLDGLHVWLKRVEEQ